MPELKVGMKLRYIGESFKIYDGRHMTCGSEHEVVKIEGDFATLSNGHLVSTPNIGYLFQVVKMPEPAPEPIREDLLDMYAAAAMQAIISKLPLFDTDGEHGVKTAPDMEQVRLDVAASAFGYAEAMLSERARAVKK